MKAPKLPLPVQARHCFRDSNTVEILSHSELMANHNYDEKRDDSRHFLSPLRSAGETIVLMELIILSSG